MSNIIVMAFSPRNIVGCFLKKRLTKAGGGGGVTGTPSLRPWCQWSPFSWPQSPSLCGRRRQGIGEERRKNKLDQEDRRPISRKRQKSRREKMERGKGRGTGVCVCHSAYNPHTRPAESSHLHPVFSSATRLTCSRLAIGGSERKQRRAKKARESRRESGREGN